MNITKLKMIWDFLLLNLSYDDFLLSNEDEEERVQIIIEGGNFTEEERIEYTNNPQEWQIYIIEIEKPIEFQYKKDNNIITALAA